MEVNAHFTAELGHLELLLSDPIKLEEGNAPENGPLTRIHNITKEQIAEYRESSKWTDNQAYQPPVCINALMGFEDSFIGGGILGDDVGLGKTIETIGLLLARSNQQRDMISRGETVPKALPTIIIVPQNIVFQWVSDIERFTERFTIAVCYGAFFNRNESNSDLIVITSYSTLSARHGPRALWKDTKNILKKKWNAKRRHALSLKEFAQALTDNEVDKFKVIVDNPNQLHGLFNRVIVDEGHTIRNQSKEIGNTSTSLGGSYRLIITGTHHNTRSSRLREHHLSPPELDAHVYSIYLGQERSQIDEGKRIPISEDDKDDVQKILNWHCQGSPKLRKLLELLAEIVVLRKEKAIIWVNSPARMQWLCPVLSLCGIDARQLRTDLPAKELDALIHDYDRDPKTASVLICSFLVSCAGLNLQNLCRTFIEFEPPPNESTRQQARGRVKWRGSLGTWVRHITLPTKDTLNTKQDFDSILKNLPVLVTQLDLKIFGTDNGHEDDGPIEVLGKCVLHEAKLYPADHEDVQDLHLEPLSSDNLLLAISLIMAGRKPEGDVKAMRKRLAAGNKAGRFEEFNKLDPLWEGGPEETDSSEDDDLY
ncbi:hypothetical protein IQ07DRAFT_680068 [Pyrenochaeta sp. DS3sAY3a]|nr:hypothetical protein IQ07DRAFT_680068 [Pyrenochaeta sp. DS3sAY3a]